jgi:hypothetical protein
MFSLIKVGVFFLGVLWLMQHYAPENLPASMRPNSYSEWGSNSSAPNLSTPNLSGYVSKTGEAARSLAAQIQMQHR